MFRIMNKKTITSHDSAGFTLIELLTVIAIIGVLASIAMQGQGIYRQAAYRTRMTNSMNQLKTALQAGTVNRGSDVGFIWTFANESGPPIAGNAAEIVPGYVNTEQQLMHAWYDGQCDNGQFGDFCAIESASIWSCKIGYQTVYTRWRNGFEQNWSWQGVPWC